MCIRDRSCSRQLITDFSYVWITVVLTNAFARPTRRLFKSSPQAQRFNAVVRSLNPCKPAEKPNNTKKLAGRIQKELARVFSTLLIVIVFGKCCPLLLLLAPFGAWLSLCSLRWCEDVGQTRKFEEQIVGRMLVHPPISPFRCSLHVGNWMFTAFVFIDLEFGVGPILLYITAAISEVLVTWWRNRAWARASPDTVRAETNPIMELKSVSSGPVYCGLIVDLESKEDASSDMYVEWDSAIRQRISRNNERTSRSRHRREENEVFVL
eukprot:TRINITY_DN2481_c0_g2_i1.p2 TRINITY_DN2481_c0_g2~~TRINITY_DN2481_c0_g2_i1.p2  ORF type:complete len:266 (-),score=39.74 TRINITY_DN2481_c0_g2_i1:227-1024(-)